MNSLDIASAVDYALRRRVFTQVNFISPNPDEETIAWASMISVPRAGEFVHIYRKVTDLEPCAPEDRGSLVDGRRYKGKFRVLRVSWRATDNLAIGTENVSLDNTCWVTVVPATKEESEQD